jgi:short-subunit dehydrogenase
MVGARGLGGLVNNAGVGLGGPLELVPMDKIRWLFDVNVFGLVEVTQAFLPALRRGRGRIANIGSTASLFVAPFHGPYSATKYAVNAFSDALRLELRPHGVSVSVIVTGSVRTPIWGKSLEFMDRLKETAGPEAAGLYGAAASAVERYFARLGASGAEPEEAARVIGRVFTDRRARARYFVGREARFQFVLDKVVHGELRDRIVLRSVGLSARSGEP